MLRPSLTLVLDLDERNAEEETILEIKRSYSHITTPVIRVHKADPEEPVKNTAVMRVNMGTYTYWSTADAAASERWSDIVEPWLGNMLHKVGNNMKVFNDRQREIGLPEVPVEHVEIVLENGAFTMALRTTPTSWIDPALNEAIGRARELVQDGLLKGAVRVDAPADESYQAQRDAAWGAWVLEHPEALEPKPAPEEKKPEEEAPAQPDFMSEEWLEADKEAKSYENTAVAPTDSNELPPIEREEEEPEAPQFTFDVSYDSWLVTFADGAQRTFDAAAGSFADEA